MDYQLQELVAAARMSLDDYGCSHLTQKHQIVGNFPTSFGKPNAMAKSRLFGSRAAFAHHHAVATPGMAGAAFIETLQMALERRSRGLVTLDGDGNIWPPILGGS